MSTCAAFRVWAPLASEVFVRGAFETSPGGAGGGVGDTALVSAWLPIALHPEGGGTDMWSGLLLGVCGGQYRYAMRLAQPPGAPPISRELVKMVSPAPQSSTMSSLNTDRATPFPVPTARGPAAPLPQGEALKWRLRGTLM